jgi:hypothetical protein
MKLGKGFNPIVGLMVVISAFAVLAISRKATSSTITNNSKDEEFTIDQFLGNEPILVLGDSQVGRSIGKSITERFPNNEVILVYREGYTPKKFMADGDMILSLANQIVDNNVRNMIVQFGDNGIYGNSRVKELARCLKDLGVENIFWIGSHVKTVPKNRDSSYVHTSPTSDDDWRFIPRYNDLAKSWNQSMMSNLENIDGVIFIDPFDYYPVGEYDETTASVDGVHLDKGASDDFINSVF